MEERWVHPSKTIPTPNGTITVWVEETPYGPDVCITVVSGNKALEHHLYPINTAGLLSALAEFFNDQLAHKRQRLEAEIAKVNADIKKLKEELKELPEESHARKYYEDQLAGRHKLLEKLVRCHEAVDNCQIELFKLKTRLEELEKAKVL